MKILQINKNFIIDNKIDDISFENAQDQLKLILMNESIDQDKILLSDEAIYVNNMNKIPNIIKEPSLIDKILKNYIRNIKINIKFNIETKKFEITNENLSENELDEMNTINYFKSCSDFVSNELFFNQSSIFNSIYSSLKNCNTFLAIIFYNDDEMYFCCYDKNTKNILKDIEFNKLNKITYNRA